MLVATTVERAARQHTASAARTSLVAPGTKSPAEGSMAPGHRDGDLEASRREAEK